MGEPHKLSPQRKSKVQNPRATDCQDNGYTEHRFRPLYQREELERGAEGQRKGWQAGLYA